MMDLKRFYSEILKSNGINESVSEVVVKDTGIPGASKTQYVTINLENGTKPPVQLFLKKVQSENETLSKLTEESKLFVKETIFYSKYLPAIKEFCKSLGQDHLMEIYPKFYFGDGEMLLFENLASRGFALPTKTDRQDFETAKLSLTSLAKHHGLSHAFIQHVGGLESFVKQFPTLGFESYMQPAASEFIASSIEKAIIRNIYIVGKTEIEGQEKALKLLMGACDDAFELTMEPIHITPLDEPSLVLNHGDYRNDNMFFGKHEKTGELISQIMVDFQTTRYGNPCLDLSYFMFNSVDPSVRRDKLPDLLKVYLDTLKSTCNSLGYPIQLALKELFLNFRKKINFGFWINMMHDNGLGLHEIIDDMDEDVRNDRERFLNEVDQFILVWLEQHPEKRARMAKVIIALMEEYSQLLVE